MDALSPTLSTLTSSTTVVVKLQKRVFYIVTKEIKKNLWTLKLLYIASMKIWRSFGKFGTRARKFYIGTKVRIVSGTAV